MISGSETEIAMATFMRPKYNEIEGTNDNDTLNGGDERDRIYGRGGDDLIFGNGGDDVIGGGYGEDTVYGGRGNDFIYPGQSGKKTYYGEEGDDQLIGLYNEDTLRGGPGNDTLSGGSPQLNDSDFTGDWLFGGEGDDQLNLGSHLNFATGGDGADTFTFTLSSRTTTTPAAISVIEDFNPDEGDKIEVNYYLHSVDFYEPDPVTNPATVVPIESDNLIVDPSIEPIDFNFDLNIELIDFNLDIYIEPIGSNLEVSYNSDTGALFLNDIQFAQLSPGIDFVPERDIHVETLFPIY